MRPALIIFLLTISGGLSAQHTFYGGFFPEMAANHSLGDFKLTAKIESRHGVVNNEASKGETWTYFHDQTDLQGFLGYKINPFTTIAGGYQYRIDSEDENTHRAIEQLTIIQQIMDYRVGHRVRADQTFFRSDKMQWRLRYRLAVEVPLQGFSLDPAEFYLVLSGEPIFSLQGRKTELENRLVVSLGHYFSDRCKLETGLDYRTDRYLGEGFRNRLWWKTGCYLNL